MKKKYEQPMAELVKFEISEKIMDYEEVGEATLGNFASVPAGDNFLELNEEW